MNPDGKENYTDWTQEVPPFMVEKIRSTAAAQWQADEESFGNALQKCGQAYNRKQTIQKDVDLKIKNSIFPPAIPLRCLETTKNMLVTNGFGGIKYHLKINPKSCQRIQLLRTADEPVALFNIPTEETQKMITRLASLRSRQNNLQLDDQNTDESIIVVDNIPHIFKAVVNLKNEKIIDKKDNVEEKHAFTADRQIVTYLNSRMIPGPNAASNSREITLKYHGVKRPFDLVQGRQTGPMSKKQRLSL